MISATGAYDHNPGPDLLRFLRSRRQLLFNWRLSREGQFHSVAINEGVAALLLFAFGRPKFEIERKERLFPICTIYDVFWKHAYSQLYYALYDGARFIAVGTPSGTSLSRESGTHQSIQTPAIIMGLPKIIYYEPAFAFDLSVIYEWAIRQMTDSNGEAVYLRLSTQEILQPWGALDSSLLKKHGLSRYPTIESGEEAVERLREAVLAGGYWILDYRSDGGYRPRSNAALIFATGPIIEEAIKASQTLLDLHGIYANVCNVTSWERLKRDYEFYWSSPEIYEDEEKSYHLHDLVPANENSAPCVIVGDFSPQVAEWACGAFNRRIPILGTKGFSQAGDIRSVRRHHQLDSDSIVEAILREFSMKPYFSKPSVA